MRINTDRLLSLIAMLIGLGSLFIIVYQTALLREQQEASALPYLMVGIVANPERPDKAIIEITYRSVYGDRWRVTSDTVVPKPL
jgi:hypothetical protein